MSAVSQERLVRDFSLASAGRTAVLVTTKAQRLTVMLSIVTLALALRLYGIGLYSFGADEYGSMIEARWLGLNWNSIIYSTVMHFWVQFGSSEVWLRLPAAVIGVATVPLVFKIGEKLGGWRTGVVAGALAATSPFNIYHSQEVRFYSLFMFAAAAFTLATISYVESRRSVRDRAAMILAGVLLLVSHFMGIVALYAQGAAGFMSAGKRRLHTRLILLIGIPVIAFLLPAIPPVRNQLLHLYQVWGNGVNADLSATQPSLLSLAKLAFAGYTLIFGYHVYPLRLLLIIPGIALCLFLLTRGVLRLFRERKFATLPVMYAVALVGIYLGLDAVGGRLASGVAPRHAAFVWPVFIVLLALGLSSFTKILFQIFLAGILVINSFSLGFGWQRDWSYGYATDYRAAGAYAAAWTGKDSAIMVDSRAFEVLDSYFPHNLPLTQRPGTPEFAQASYRRLIVVTNDWRPLQRQESNEMLEGLNDKFAVVTGRVDYPLFEYVLERRPAGVDARYGIRDNGQIAQPLSIYPIEFQDLKLPLDVRIDDTSLNIIGAYGLPNDRGERELNMPLLQVTAARKLLLVTNLVSAPLTTDPVAEVVIEDKTGSTTRFPLRVNQETALWSYICAPAEPCKTVAQWHKRIAIAGQNSFSDAHRDFSAGLQGAILNLPASTEVKRIAVRYLSGSGHLYLWGVAVHQ